MAYGRYRAFAAAAQYRSFTLAAEALGYTQSGVSHLVAALEQELGFPLLIRGKGGVTLTGDGETLLPYVKRMLAAEKDVMDVADDVRGLLRGTLRVGTISSIAINYLPPIIRDFGALYPGVEIALMSGSYADVEEALSEGRIDCGFVTLPSRPEFLVRLLLQDRLLAVVNAGSPLAGQSVLTAADIANEPFIVPAEGTDYDIGKLFDAAGVSPHISMEMSDDYAAVAMVRQGLGVTILPELLMEGIPRDNIMAVPLSGTSRRVGIAVERQHYQAPAVRTFIGFVKERMAGLHIN